MDDGSFEGLKQRYISNELTHFVGRRLSTEDKQFALLVRILKTGRLLATGLEREENEDVGALRFRPGRRFSENEMYEPSMVCFCDIPVTDLGIHISKYSHFGLALRKHFLIAKGVAPVFYIPRGSRVQGRTRAMIMDALSGTLKRIAGTEDERAAITGEWDKLLDTLEWHLFPFFKFFDETTAEEHPDNFYMEREWRRLGNVFFQLADVTRVIIPESYAARFRKSIPRYVGQLTFVN